ncbi:MAG: PAS domain S-box protein, partial [Candidatus Neomarinimicrobiota bacterium]
MKSKEIILYLEDRRADALLVKRSLQSLPFPFRFIHARTKEQYLEYLRDKQPSIILVDYQVPGYDGLSAIRDARHYRPYTPIVVVTGSIGEEAAVQCIQAGASDFVLKDQRARLIAVIDNVLVQWRARRKIKESEEKYRSLFIGSREGVIVVDRKGKVLEINPAFENITGLSSRTLVGKGAYTLAKTFVSLDDLPRVVRIINDALLGHDIPPFDLHWRNKILEITVPAVANVFGRAAVVRDVTEERRQYSALAESEARYRDLVENTNDLLCVHDLEGRFLMVNRAVCRRLRYSKETLLKKNLRDVLAPDVKDQFYLYLDTIRKEKRATGIMKVRDRYGKIYIWEYNNSLNESGETPVVRGIAHDITEVYEATRKLKASEARYRDLVENSHDIIYLHDEFGILIWVNEAIRRILGFSPRRFERSNIRTFIQKPYLHEWDDYLVRIRSEGKAEGYVRLLDRQGKEHILEYRAVRQSQPEGPPLYQGIARDVTEQIHNLERLEEREAEFRS